MADTNGVHDSGLHASRLLARLLHAGVVMLDAAQDCCFASERACQLLGAADEVALRHGWPGILARLDLTALPPPGSPPVQRAADLETPRETKRLRLEIHAVQEDPRIRHVVLLRDRSAIDDGDRTLLLASKAQANRPALSGLVHDAKGPLNNFQLTIALLAGGLERLEAVPGTEAITTRWHRYLDVLHAEASRLAGCMNDINALAQLGHPGRVRVDLASSMRDVARLLRHEATMRETTIEFETDSTPVWITADPDELGLALLGFATCLVDATNPGGTIRMHVAIAAGASQCIACFRASPAMLPTALAAELFAVHFMGVSRYPAAVAGRLIVEAHGGAVEIDCQAPASSFIVRMPAG